MRAMERKVVHTYLSERSDVETHSEGDEPDRRLVVSPVERFSWNGSRRAAGAARVAPQPPRAPRPPRGAAAGAQIERILEALAAEPDPHTSVADPEAAIEVHVADALSGLQVA